MITHSSHIARALAEERVRDLRSQAAGQSPAGGDSAVPPEEVVKTRRATSRRARLAGFVPPVSIGRMRRSPAPDRRC